MRVCEPEFNSPESREDTGSSGYGVTGTCEPSNKGAGKATWVLRKRSKCSYAELSLQLRKKKSYKTVLIYGKA